MYLIVYWLILSISIGFVILFQKYLKYMNALTSNSISASRKIFHLLICCVFIPGLFYDVEFLAMCSYGMLILLLLLELIRYHGIGKLSETIDETMVLFVDRKDCNGQLILSHIYLLVGLSLPIWLSNFTGKLIKNLKIIRK